MSVARLSAASIWSMASALGPRSPEASRSCTRFAAASIGQTTRSVVTLAPAPVAISRNRRRCSSDRNEPTATTRWLRARASVTAAAIAEYACAIASLLRSPEAVRAAAPNSSANVSDAKLTAPPRSTARCASVDFPDPGTPQTMTRRCLLMRSWRRRPHTTRSSARARSVSGTTTPSSFAVLRLMTSSNLDNSATGRSLGWWCCCLRRMRAT
jgi:hypothetical protein